MYVYKGIKKFGPIENGTFIGTVSIEVTIRRRWGATPSFNFKD